MWRGSGKGWPTSVMFLASAPTWKGPYKFETKNLFPQFTHTHIEDAHMWVQQSVNGTRSWHAIFHSDVTGKCGGAGGGHAWSENGEEWTFSKYNAYCNDVELTNGTTVFLRQRERPHLMVDERGQPTLLTNGAGWKGDCDRTFTFAQPVATATRRQ